MYNYDCWGVSEVRSDRGIELWQRTSEGASHHSGYGAGHTFYTRSSISYGSCRERPSFHPFRNPGIEVDDR